MIMKKTHPKSVMMRLYTENDVVLGSFEPQLKMNDGTMVAVVILQSMIINDNYILVELVKKEYFKGMLP